ncbi:MAG: serine/threonine-protein kinase [Planctomycetota bacterium]|nr:serine/threonine-protein kinase [Planctomycetota bacterium]
MTARNEDFLFAQEALNLGYVTEAQVDEGFQLQKRMAEDLRIDERLAVILVKRAWLAEEQARRVYAIIEPEGAHSRIEGYRLVQKVGRGAMGTVYKAVHKGLNRVVAIKILRRDLATDKTQIERLKREAKLLADLDHPNVVRAFDAGESNGFPYLVMEFVEGETLRDRIAREGALPEEDALRITRGVADALEKARRIGIVHRDVKPGNILISKTGTPKLMDLGLAKGPIDAALTQHGATVGTPQFMSPEQAESPDKADTRSDIYSLGATLYAMVTGRPPFDGSTLAEIITKVMSQQPVPPRVRNPSVSVEVSHLIERMMLKDCTLRYATPALVIADIESILGGQSIIPRGFQGNWEAYLLRKRFLAWRKRILVGAVAAVTLGVGAWVYLDHKEKDLARHDIAARSAQLAEIPGVGPQDDIASLQSRIARLRVGQAELQEVADQADVAFTRRDEIENLRVRLQRALELLQRCESLAEAVAPLRASGDWRGALQQASRHESELERSPPSRRCWTELVSALHTGSAEALASALVAAEGLGVADIDAFLARSAALRAIYEQPWIEEPGFARRREAVLAADDKSRRIGQWLGAELIAPFAPSVIKSRLEAHEFYDVRMAFRDAEQALRRKVQAELDSWPLTAERPQLTEQLLGEQGLISLAIRRADEDIDRSVEAVWQQLRASLDGRAPDEGQRALAEFFNAADRGNHYEAYAKQARALHEARQQQMEVRLREARAAFELARDSILGALRAGQIARIREAADAAIERGVLNTSQRDSILALRTSADALEALHDGALAHLEAMLRADNPATLRDVVVRDADGTWREVKSWKLVRTLPERRALVHRVPRGDRRGEVEVPLADISLPTLLAWAGSADRAPTGLLLDILEVAASEAAVDEPGVDLRARFTRYRGLQARFGDSGLAAPWRRLLGELAASLEAAHGKREDEAVYAIEYIRQHLVRKERWKRLVELVDDMLDPKGRLSYSKAVEENRADLEQRRTWALEELERDELRRLFHGDVRPTALPAGETEILFDFDDPNQLENFESGLARRERVARGATVVTPGEEEGGQLHLLPGMREFVRDRPLALLSMFDPAAPIRLQFRAHLLRGSSVLAFDLDGVQLAICSFDPNLWKRRFLDGAPRMAGETELPEFDFYGMGRGVAFHQGTGFGQDFPYGGWDWAAEGQGRHFVRLRDRALVEKAGGALFALEPGGSSVMIAVERDREFMRLYVGGKLVLERSNLEWAMRGARSERDRKIRNGSGRLQILSWSPMVIDDLTVRGTVTEAWKVARRAVLAARAERDEASK